MGSKSPNKEFQGVGRTAYSLEKIVEEKISDSKFSPESQKEWLSKENRVQNGGKCERYRNEQGVARKKLENVGVGVPAFFNFFSQ